MPAFDLLICLGIIPVLSLSSHPSDSSTHQSEDHTTKARATSHSVPGGKTLWGCIHFLELPEQFTTNWWLKCTEPVLSQFGRLTVQNQGVERSMPPQKALGKNPSWLLSWLVIVSGNARHPFAYGRITPMSASVFT